MTRKKLTYKLLMSALNTLRVACMHSHPRQEDCDEDGVPSWITFSHKSKALKFEISVVNYHELVSSGMIEDMPFDAPLHDADDLVVLCERMTHVSSGPSIFVYHGIFVDDFLDGTDVQSGVLEEDLQLFFNLS